MMCVNIFPCRDSLSIDIPRNIQNYYRICLDEEYKVKMQKKFDLRLDLIKREKCFVYDALKNIFDVDSLVEMISSRPINHDDKTSKI